MKIIISHLLIFMMSLESFSQYTDLIYPWPGNVPGSASAKTWYRLAEKWLSNIL
jgi:hypothetical protein